jgi:flagellin
MRINNNIMAMNAHRQLAINQSNASKSMEKLSSGLRINRAGDDAAGLAISEKMRGQIRGLKQAQRNAQDGISLIQTAEGALNEIHAILQRMRELATQSATDTNTEVDRLEIQKEIDQLASEITRIADTTEFNTQNLLGGKFTAKFHIGANEGQNVDLDINSMSAAALEVAGDVTYVANSAIISATYTGVNNDNVGEGTPTQATIETGSYTVGVSEGAYTLLDSEGEVVANSSDGITFIGVGQGAGIPDKIVFGSALKLGAKVDIDTDETTATVNFDEPIEVSVANKGLDTGVYTVTAEGIENAKGEVVATYDPNENGYVNADGEVVLEGVQIVNADGEVVLEGVQIAAGTEFTVGGINVSSQDKADAAITTINDAIETVSAERSKLGAMQNRLEHTIANLGTSAENLQAAESRIRDLDMAEEIMAFTKNNILQQAATAMLAQANMAPQSVLQLLG